MTESQFMVQVLDSLTNLYELQMVLMEESIGNKETPLNWWTMGRTKLKIWEAVIGSINNHWHWFDGGEGPVYEQKLKFETQVICNCYKKKPEH
jgi:hypothetical protein